MEQTKEVIRNRTHELTGYDPVLPGVKRQHTYAKRLYCYCVKITGGTQESCANELGIKPEHVSYYVKTIRQLVDAGDQLTISHVQKIIG